ncbi:hypothetical protein OL229_05965 [Neisseriaceae bacterium JH1-16]|nr:hypothetical protein [Neisseriaceae bacterium JH1-16]
MVLHVQQGEIRVVVLQWLETTPFRTERVLLAGSVYPVAGEAWLSVLAEQPSRVLLRAAPGRRATLLAGLCRLWRLGRGAGGAVSPAVRR